MLLGAEGPGLPAELIAKARSIRIPMAPGLRSMNVVASASMALGEALRQTNGFPSAAPAEYADGIVVVQPSRGLIATSAGSGQDIQTPY